MFDQRNGAGAKAARDQDARGGAVPGKQTLVGQEPMDEEAADLAGPAAAGPASQEAPIGGAVANPLDGGTPAPTPGPTATPAPTTTPTGPGASIAGSFSATRVAHPTAPVFGEVNWNAHEPTATYAAYRDGANWRFRLESLALRVPVGVAGGTRRDVPSANAATVTAATWRRVASDLTPGGGTPNRSPRTQYWAEDLTWRHEVFHFNEYNTFLRTSFTSFETTIEAATYVEAATATDTEAAALGRKAADLRTRLLAAWNQAKTNMSPSMEDRAYDDGVALYQARADAVRARAAAASWR
ncbi:MAG: hypothetical protein WKG01_01945 [Kofleriaceae bacterium]